MTITAIVLAAGLSSRMGQPKMLLPWGDTTIIAQVAGALHRGGADDVVVVTGATHDEIARALENKGCRLAFNPDYANGEMLSSLQAGLKNLPDGTEAVLVGLGDQPQMLPETVAQVIAEYRRTGEGLIVPSYQMRRGHPWLAARSLWDELLSLEPPYTLRGFLASHAEDIHYQVVDTPTILADLDTPEDYDRERPA